MRRILDVLLTAAVVTSDFCSRAQETTPTEGNAAQLKSIVVVGRADDLLGVASSGSEGVVGSTDLQQRPFLRRGELLEVVPGLVVTQHSGDGKANQYFLRGFNLDHGNDISISLEGMPINLRTHAHGQGYSDLNFIIPELVETIEFKKGPFYPEVGDFSGAGAVEFHLFNTLPQGFVKIETGEFGYLRLLAAESNKICQGSLTYAFEFNHYDGPWIHNDDSKKYNLFFRYNWSEGDDQFNLTAMAYHGDWHSTDQVPQRAIQEGLIDRFGAIEPSDGGASDRDSIAFDWLHAGDTGATHLNLYAFYYRLNLFSDFTYFLSDPVNGDQFEQVDKRFVTGGTLSRTWNYQLWGRLMENTLGLQFRNDLIPEVGINNTKDRVVLSEVRKDRVDEFSAGIYGKNKVQWTDWLRTEIGFRGDLYYFHVHSHNLSENSGDTVDGIANPKFSMVLGPWEKTELYFDLGGGFHSNDARGVESNLDPVSHERIGSAPGLVRSKGAEIGIRTSILTGLVSTVSFWYLKSDSELLFQGDSGTTTASSPSRRYGVEWANFYKPTSWLTLDADFAFTHARFVNNPAGTRIPNSLSQVITAGISIDAPCGLFGSLRLRYFGPQPLIKDNTATGPSSTLFNGKIGYRYKNYELALEVLNIFDTQANDIVYFYTSRLRGEPAAGVNDFHLHPAEPRQFRGSLTVRF